MRSLRSRPLALTLLSSNAQRRGPLLPAARANPVMLLTDISQVPLLARQVPLLARIARPMPPESFDNRSARMIAALLVHIEFRRRPLSVSVTRLGSLTIGNSSHDQDPCGRGRAFARPVRIRARPVHNYWRSCWDGARDRRTHARTSSPPSLSSPSPSHAPHGSGSGSRAISSAGARTFEFSLNLQLSRQVIVWRAFLFLFEAIGLTAAWGYASVFFCRVRLRVLRSTRGPSTRRTTAPHNVRTSCCVGSLRWKMLRRFRRIPGCLVTGRKKPFSSSLSSRKLKKASSISRCAGGDWTRGIVGGGGASP